MPRTTTEWEWGDAFDKFGFEDGDGWNGTHLVASSINALGYRTECDGWGCHNYLIVDIEKDGKSILFDDNRALEWNAETLKRIQARGGGEDYAEYIGYADPELFLPEDILEMLNATFTDDYEVAA